MPRKINRETPLGAARALLNISAEQLSKRSGVAKSTIAKIEQKRLPMTYDLARRLSWATWFHPDWLINGNPKEPETILRTPWQPEVELCRARVNSSRMDEDERKTAMECAQVMLNATHGLLIRAIEDGKVWRVITDLDLSFREIARRYYPEKAKELFGDEPTTPPQMPRSCRPSQRKPRA